MAVICGCSCVKSDDHPRPGRRDRTRVSAPWLPAVPAFGPWDGREAAPRSVFELRVPAARGQGPIRAERSGRTVVPPRGEPDGGRVRVGESRVLLPRASRLAAGWRGDANRMCNSAATETPRPRAGADGAFERSLDRTEDGPTRVLVCRSLHHVWFADANLACTKSCSTPRRSGRDPGVACAPAGDS